MRGLVLTRFSVLLLLSFLLAPGAGAQEGEAEAHEQEEATAREQEEAEEAAQAREASPALVSPRDRVTELVREAMRGPDRREVWAGLALSLSEMDRAAREGGEKLEGLEEAVRIADSLAFAAGVSGVPASAGSRGPWSPWRWETYPESLGSVSRHPMALPGFLTLVLAGLLLARSRQNRRIRDRNRKRRGEETGDARRKRQEAELVRKPQRPASGEQSPWDFALALWESGLPPTEVARRTGLAQDTLAVLLTLKGGQDEDAGPYVRRGRA